jgi:LysM repeat protein/phage baseplate assembly protein W
MPVLASIAPQKCKVNDPPFTLTVRGSGFTTDSKVLFGGTEVATIYADASVLMASISQSDYANFSLGGVTVAVTNGNSISNTVQFDVTKDSPVSVAELSAIASAITIPNITALLQDNSPYVEQVPFVQVYRIHSGDTLTGIAQKVTGDASNWQDIAFINNLRHPFITDDPKLLTGQTDYTLILTKDVHPGDSVIYVNGITPYITESAVLFFAIESPLTDGKTQLISDITTIAQVTPDLTVPANTNVRLVEPVFNTYLTGTKVDVLTTTNNSTSRLVAVGDFVLVPATRGNQSFVQSDAIDITRVYHMLGQDVALDADGLMTPDENGDLATFNGVANLHQAISHRLLTEIGELVYHPTYGNPLLDYVGNLNVPELAVMANYEIQRCLKADPRIKDISDINTTVQGDTLAVRVLTEVDLFNSSTEFNFVIPIE